MGEIAIASAAGTVTVSENIWEERRRTDRVAIELPVRVRPLDPQESSFDEVCTTVDASRDGLYFTTQCPSYRVGMQLLITCP